MAPIESGGGERKLTGWNRAGAAVLHGRRRETRRRCRFKAYGARFAERKGPEERGEDGELTTEVHTVYGGAVTDDLSGGADELGFGEIQTVAMALELGLESMRGKGARCSCYL